MAGTRHVLVQPGPCGRHRSHRSRARRGVWQPRSVRVRMRADRANFPDLVRTVRTKSGKFVLTALSADGRSGCAIGRDVRVLAFEERHKLLSTELEVTVAGHPRRVREFHQDVSGSAIAGTHRIGSGDDLLGDVVAWIVVEGVSAVGSAAWHKWQARNDPPLESDDLSTSLRARTVVFWKW